MIHLDTSFLIRALVARSPEDRSLRFWLRRGEMIAASAVVWAEFLCGPIEPADAEVAALVVRERIPFNSEDAVLAASLFNAAGRRRGSLADCMIAASAIRRDAELATSNAADFKTFTANGLRLAGR